MPWGRKKRRLSERKEPEQAIVRARKVAAATNKKMGRNEAMRDLALVNGLVGVGVMSNVNRFTSSMVTYRFM